VCTLTFQNWPALRRESSATLATTVMPAAPVKPRDGCVGPSPQLNFSEPPTTQSYVCTGAQVTQGFSARAPSRLLWHKRRLMPPLTGRGLLSPRSHPQGEVTFLLAAAAQAWLWLKPLLARPFPCAQPEGAHGQCTNPASLPTHPPPTPGTAHPCHLHLT